MPNIHPTAIIDPRATFADDVTNGPYVVVEGHVCIGPRTVVRPHCVLKGPTQIGADCEIGPAAYVGGDSQHLRFDRGQETWLVIGDGTIIREAASVHRATRPGIENATRVGSGCLLMCCSHVAHDDRVGDRVILANAVLLAGHVTVADGAIVSGGTGVHQFVRIGRLAIVSGNEAITNDVPPFAAARYGGLKGYNAIGCKRAGISREGIQAIRKAYHCYHTHRTFPARLRAIREQCPDVPETRELLAFFAASKRGMMPSTRFKGAVAGENEGGGEA
jgi:UDP-N-acetylglucosamine acyltransferase